LAAHRRVTVALTRPRGTGGDLAARLAAQQIEVLDCALTQITPALADELAHARAVCAQADAVVLVSPQAVKAALEAMPQLLQERLIAVMGQGSRHMLERAGIRHAQIIESATQDGLGLVDRLFDRIGATACVAIGRAQLGRDDLARALSARGTLVNFVTLYHRDELPWPRDMPQRLARAAHEDLRILFTTSSAPHAFWQRLAHSDVAGVGSVLKDARALCTHPNVAQAARDAGFAQVIVEQGDEATWFVSLQSNHD
jgi:uroporphyrinogen-III synthase